MPNKQDCKECFPKAYCEQVSRAERVIITWEWTALIRESIQKCLKQKEFDKLCQMSK